MSSEPAVLSDLFEVNPRRLISRGAEVPFVAMADVQEHRRHVNNWTRRAFKSGSRFKNGDTLVARITPCLENGKTAFVDFMKTNEVGHGSTEFIVLAPRDSKAISLFGYYLAISPHFRDYAIGRMIGSSGRQRVSAEEIAQYPLKFAPTLTEQRSIVEVLGALDDRIDWCATLQDALHSLGELALSRALEVEGMSASRSLPAAGSVRLGEWLDTLESGSRPRGGVKGVQSGVPSVGAESIERAGFFDYSKTRYVSREFFGQMRRGQVQDFDVLVYKDGGRPGEFIPHVSLAGSGHPFGEFAINDHVYRVRVRQPYSQSVLYFWLRTPQATEEMAMRGTGAAQPGLNQANFRDVPLPLLSRAQLGALDTELSAILRLILHLGVEQRKLSELRDSLLPKLVSGELRIPDPEALLEPVG